MPCGYSCECSKVMEHILPFLWVPKECQNWYEYWSMLLKNDLTSQLGKGNYTSGLLQPQESQPLGLEESLRERKSLWHQALLKVLCFLPSFLRWHSSCPGRKVECWAIGRTWGTDALLPISLKQDNHNDPLCPHRPSPTRAGRLYFL